MPKTSRSANDDAIQTQTIALEYAALCTRALTATVFAKLLSFRYILTHIDFVSVYFSEFDVTVETLTANFHPEDVGSGAVAVDLSPFSMTLPHRWA